MNKTLKIYIAILTLLFIGAIAFEASRPKPIDWTPSFSEKDAIPFGIKVFRDELPTQFPNDSIIDLHETAYEFLENHYNWDEDIYNVKGSYIKIKPSFNVDQVSIEKLLNFAAEGNTLFIASEGFPEILQDSLQFVIDNKYSFQGSAKFRLANNAFKGDSITDTKGRNNYYFKKLNKETTTVLGYQDFEDTHINFVKIKYKKGTILLYTQPYAFTNYYLLKGENYKYVTDVLSYLPDGTVLFDSDFKQGNYISDSPLRYIFSKPALKWAWLLAVFFIITFMLFNAKRRQRAISIITPLQNTTVQFTKTVANLYYESKDHNNIIDKKITYFFEKIRRDYHLNTAILDEKFIHQLSLKSGVKEEKVKKLIDYILSIKDKSNCTEENLIDLNKLIEKFYQKK